ncbi:hypothetical protein BH10PSE18_BH10PSE18_18820 [soil metagenome]
MTRPIPVAAALGPAGRAMWLFLRNDGGWWSVAQATHAWHPTFSDFEAGELLEALRLGHYVESRPLVASTPHTLAYAVTSNCQPFPGLPLNLKEGCPA